MPVSVKEEYAAGDLVIRENDLLVRIEAAFEKPGWQGRLPGTYSEPEFPGTAVKFEGRYYEVIAVQPLDQGRVAYDLQTWDRRFPLRGPQAYSREACERLAEERRSETRRGQASFGLLLLSPLVGLLPAETQYRLDRETGLDAPRSTLISALAVLLVTGPLSILATALSFGGMFGAAMEGYGWVVKWQLVIWYLFLESALRAFWAFQSAEAMGSLPVVLVAEALGAIRNKKNALGKDPSTSPERDLSEVSDEPSQEAIRRQRSTWVETFAIVWGAVDEPTQRDLERFFEYDTEINTKRNVYVELGLGCLATVTALAHVIQGPGICDVVILLLGIAAVLEAAKRLLHLERGTITPSAAQVILKPLARRLLSGLDRG